MISNSAIYVCISLCLQSGLTQAVRESKISLSSAKEEMLDFLKEHAERGRGLLAGNSVHEDKRFLVKYMPEFMEHLHYRIVDVSTIKELCRWVQININILMMETHGGFIQLYGGY